MTGAPDRPNLPPLRLHVPEPKYRPGDAVDYGDLDIPAAEAEAMIMAARRHLGWISEEEPAAETEPAEEQTAET